MSDTPIYDAVAEDLENPAEDVSPGSYDPPAEEDPEPVLNDDADDDLSDVPEGEDDGDTDLDDGPEDGPEEDVPPAAVAVSEPATPESGSTRG